MYIVFIWKFVICCQLHFNSSNKVIYLICYSHFGEFVNRIKEVIRNLMTHNGIEIEQVQSLKPHYKIHYLLVCEKPMKTIWKVINMFHNKFV